MTITTLPRTILILSRVVLPDLALFDRVHPGPEGTVEVPGKLGAVSQGAEHPEEPGGVGPRFNPFLQRLVPVLGAPDVGRRDPEHLQDKQKMFFRITFINPLTLFLSIVAKAV